MLKGAKSIVSLRLAGPVNTSAIHPRGRWTRLPAPFGTWTPRLARLATGLGFRAAYRPAEGDLLELVAHRALADTGRESRSGRLREAAGRPLGPVKRRGA